MAASGRGCRCRVASCLAGSCRLLEALLLPVTRDPGRRPPPLVIGRSRERACESGKTLISYPFLLQVPQEEHEWEAIMRDFETVWNFPNACGALDGKHVAIRCPPKSGSLFYNYKKHFSIILFALADANYNFLYVDVGTNGRANDACVFSKSSLEEALQSNALNIPERGVFLGDDAFPLRPNLLKPYSRCGALNHTQTVFNYRLSRARRVVENAFGLLVARFRIFERPIPLSVETTEQLVKTCCALHNWLRKSGSSAPASLSQTGTDAPAGPSATTGDPANSAFQALQRCRATNHTREAGRVRDEYARRFVTTDSVSFQPPTCQQRHTLRTDPLAPNVGPATPLRGPQAACDHPHSVPWSCSIVSKTSRDLNFLND